MKAISLLLLRISTGALLAIWGMVRVKNPGNGLADKYYNGMFDSEQIQLAIGYGEILLGALIILGLLRIIAYPLQAVILGVGAFFIWPHFVQPFVAPFGISMFENPSDYKMLFFPSTTVFFATLVLLAFKRDDAISLDNIFRR